MPTLLVDGAAACFARPEFVRDMVTYDLPPPMAARAWFEAIHWTPAIRWRIETITILEQIATVWRDSGTGGRISCLIAPRWLVRASFDLLPTAEPTDSIGRHLAIFRRRAAAGRYARKPYLGRHDLPAAIRPVRNDDPPPSFYAGTGERTFDWMAFDRDWAGEGHLRFYRPIMVDGVVDLSRIEASNLPG